MPLEANTKLQHQGIHNIYIRRAAGMIGQIHRRCDRIFWSRFNWSVALFKQLTLVKQKLQKTYRNPSSPTFTTAHYNQIQALQYLSNDNNNKSLFITWNRNREPSLFIRGVAKAAAKAGLALINALNVCMSQ